MQIKYSLFLILLVLTIAVDARRKTHKKKNSKTHEDKPEAKDAKKGEGDDANNVSKKPTCPTDKNEENECLIENNGVDILEMIDYKGDEEEEGQDAAKEAPKTQKSAFSNMKIRPYKRTYFSSSREEPKKEEAAAKPAVETKAPAVKAFEQPSSSSKLFNLQDNKIMIPSYCRRKLSKTQIFGLSTHAKEWLKGWRDASGSADAPFDKLPLLDAAQLSKFYVAINEGLTPGPDALKPGEADAKKDLLLQSVNYHNAALTKAGWLQWMMFICSQGMPPLRSEYTANERLQSIKSAIAPELYMKRLKTMMGIAANSKEEKAGKKMSSRFRRFRKEGRHLRKQN